MPARSSFDYAIVRVVPRVERGEFVNAGVVLFCRTRRFLAARIELDRARLVLRRALHLPGRGERVRSGAGAAHRSAPDARFMPRHGAR